MREGRKINILALKKKKAGDDTLELGEKRGDCAAWKAAVE